MNVRHPRMRYAFCFVALLLIEIGIALFVKDAFIRPYGGDILVTVLLCCLIKAVLPNAGKLLPLWVFLFAAAVEIGQYMDIVSLLGLGDITFFRVLLGSTFSVADLLCYAVGCLLFLMLDRALRGKDC